MSAFLRRLCRRDFQILIANGRHITTKYFSIRYSNKVSGCAVVVGKKVAKTSVKRHQLKRRILTILHTNTLPASGCVVFIKKGAETLSYSSIETEIHNLLTVQIK